VSYRNTSKYDHRKFKKRRFEKKETCGKSGLQMTHIQKKYQKRKVVMEEGELDERSII
jgi:hypothetical protein